MDFVLSDDQEALAAELRRFLGDRVDSPARHRLMEVPGAVDRDLWSELAGMGVFSLTVPEADGGVGLGLADATVVFEELGRAAVPGPLIASFLAAALVDGAADGSVVVGAVERSAPAMVEHVDALDRLLVLDARGVSVVSAPDGGSPVPRPLDPLTPVHLLPALPDGEPLGGPDLADRLRRDGGLLAAATQIGLAQAAVDLGTAYARDRQQFGRAIGSFQAVKHLLAEAAVGVEIARAALHHAAVALDEGDGSDDAVDRARIVASASARRATETGIQVHGGIGFTWELDAHLFLKRSMVLDAAFGSAEGAVRAVAANL